jgi:hypothetical protein
MEMKESTGGRFSVGYHPLIRSLARSLAHSLTLGVRVSEAADLRSEVDWIGDVLGP